ncbi:MAG: hypothetical protein V1777_00550 [Candidatus Micrarchaeota archaeon]
MQKRVIPVFLVLIGVLFLGSLVYAFPSYLQVQGKLTNSSGALLNGTYDMNFRIYDSGSGGNPLYLESHAGANAVDVNKGVFNVLLGSITTLDLNFMSDYWLSIQIGSDSEMSPRQRLSAVGYAFVSKKSLGVECTDCLDTNQIANIYVLKSGDSISGILTIDGNLSVVNGDVNFDRLQANSFYGGNFYGSGSGLTGVAKQDTNCETYGSCSTVLYWDDANGIFTKQLDGNNWYSRKAETETISGLWDFINTTNFQGGFNGTGATIENGNLYVQSLVLKGDINSAVVSTIDVNGDFYPYLTNNYDLGSLEKKWRSIFGVTIYGDFFSGNGANITSLNASNISSGTLADTWLSSNIPKKDTAETILGTWIFPTTGITLGSTTLSEAMAGQIHASGSDNQNLWLTFNADAGSTAANLPNDYLTITGGTNIATSISNDTLTINYNGPSTSDTNWQTSFNLLDANLSQSYYKQADANVVLVKKTDYNSLGDQRYGIKGTTNLASWIWDADFNSVYLRNFTDTNWQTSWTTFDANMTNRFIRTDGSSTTTASIPFAQGLISNGIIKATADGTIWSDGTTGVTPTSGAGIRLMWIPSKGAFRAGRVTGSNWDDANIGSYSFGMGYNNKASGESSVAMGEETTASGNFSESSGYLSIASGYASTASGAQSIASGDYATASGAATTASGTSSTSIGDSSIASGYASTAIGRTITASGKGAFSAGYNYDSAEGSFVAGTGTPNIGYGQVALGYSSNGGTLKAEGTGSIAMGMNVNALTNPNVLVFGRDFSTDIQDSFNIGFGQLDYQFTSSQADFKDSNLTTTSDVNASRFCFPDTTCMTTASVSGTDTNWQTSFNLLDANLALSYYKQADANAVLVKKSDFNSLGDQRYQNVDSTFEDFMPGSAAGTGGAVSVWFGIISLVMGNQAGVSVTQPNGVFLIGSTGSSVSDNIGKSARTGLALNATAPFDITFRAKVDNTTSMFSRFGVGSLATSDSNNGMFFRFDTDDGDQNWFINIGDTNSNELRDTNIAKNTSYHLFKISVSSTKIEFFIDNVSVGSTTNTANILTAQMGIVAEGIARSPTTVANTWIDYWKITPTNRPTT